MNRIVPSNVKSAGHGALDFSISAHPRIDHDRVIYYSIPTRPIPNLSKKDGTIKVGRYSSSSSSSSSSPATSNDDDDESSNGDGSGQLLSYSVPNESKDYIPFAHSMVYTENYMIIWDCSVHFDPVAIFDGGSHFRTKPDHNLRFGLIPKTAHLLNAWENINDKSGAPIIVLWTPFCENLNIDLEINDGINQFVMKE